MSNNSEPMTESKVERRLKELKDIPARDPLKAASGRARFLSEAANYRKSQAPTLRAPQTGWIFPTRKNNLAMNVLAMLIVVATLFLGGGATVVAAQDDLPNQALYPVKLWTEDAALALENDPQEKANLLMDMAQTRLEEMSAMTERGIIPPDQVRERLEKHLRQSLLLAADMDESNRKQVLMQMHDRLQTQDRVMEQLQTHANTESAHLLTQTRQMLRTNLNLVDDGLANPQNFRNKVNDQIKKEQDKQTPPGHNQQGEPGSNGNANGGQGAGNGNDNHTPGEPNPDRPQNGNDGKGSNNDWGGGSNQGSSQGGDDSGSGGDGGGNGGGNGGGGGN